MRMRLPKSRAFGMTSIDLINTFRQMGKINDPAPLS